jgi:TonB family protein
MEEAEQQAQDAAARLNTPEFKKQMADAMAAVAKVNSPEFRKQFEDAQRAAADISDAKVREMVSRIYTKEYQKAIADAEAAAARVNAAELQERLYASMKATEDANAALFKVQPYQLLAQSNAAAAAAQQAVSAAQGDGAIAGVIVDPTGALVRGAQVAATNTDTGVQVKASTDNTGKYSLSPLPAGPYNVEVIARGFQKVLQENVRVGAKQQVEVDFKLTVGGENTTVSVTGTPAEAPPSQLPTIVVEAPASNSPRPQRVSAGVVEGNLISKVDPVYPDIAKKAHVQGSVVLRAVVAKDGTVKNLQYISGAPMLVVSAIEAVRQWKYKPYILNGEPTEVETTITVNYTFSPDQEQPGATSLNGGSENPRSIPVPMYVVQPEYTQQAREAKVSGIVLVNLVVDEQGRPQNVHILRGLGNGLDEKAVEAVKQYKFKPAMVDGTPVSATLNIEVNFKLF